MTQQDKELLLKDLCARLPYGVSVRLYDEDIRKYDYHEIGIISGKENATDEFFTVSTKIDSWIISINDFKPYLRPMSSMTEEESEEAYFKYNFKRSMNPYSKDRYYVRTISPEGLDWLNAHHFDYHGLIPMGLALEAPEGMYND